MHNNEKVQNLSAKLAERFWDHIIIGDDIGLIEDVKLEIM